MNIGVQKALDIAEKAHEGQFRYDGKTPYIVHPKQVADCFEKREYYEKCVAYLHDVIEDTNVTEEELKKHFPDFIVDAIVCLSRDEEKETFLDYILRVKENDLATKIKLKDMICNLLDDPTRHQKEKYELAYYILTNKKIYEAKEIIKKNE